jgi:hypothetical protein
LPPSSSASKQARDADGEPVHVLNVFAHHARVCLADWPVGDGKDFATSLDPATVWAAELQRLVRGHWSVEYGRHFEKDR